MKVLLLNPPMKHMITTNIPSFVDEERGYSPPLGLLYIAACLEKHTDHEIEVLDALAEEIGYERLYQEIKRISPDIVGITATTFTLIDVMIAARIIKEVDREITVIIGGPHVNIYPDETIRLENVDFLVLGEGENTFVDLVKNMGSRTKLRNVPGLVFEHEGRIVNTGLPPLIRDLDAIPFPARHLTNVKLYSSLLAKRSPITTMTTSRGCPFRCRFCNRPHFGRVFRARSAENVTAEMEECVSMGIHEILVYDDTSTVNRKRIMNICDMITRKKLDIGWDIRARVDTVDREMLAALKKAGCERIHYGVESANPEILKLLRKDITPEMVVKAFRDTKNAGIETLAYFMIGSPTETRRQILNTISFARKLRPDYVHFSVLTPFPSTEIYTDALKDGTFREDYWRKFAAKPTTDFVPRLFEDVLSREELIELLELAYKSFYLRPGYILRKLSKVRSLDELLRKASGGMKLLKA